MAGKSRRIGNVNGASVGPLKQVTAVDQSKGLVANAVKNAPSAQKALTSDMLAAVKQFIADSGDYQLKLDAKMSDILLGRIASLLDEVKESFTQNELAEIKAEILDEISSTSASSIIKNFLVSQLADLFDGDAKKEDIEELKAWMQQNIKQEPTAQQTEKKETSAVEDQSKTGGEQTVEDEEKGDFKDSTPANNFYTLQTFVQKQFDALNDNLKNIPGQSGIFSKIGAIVSGTVVGIVGRLTSIGKSLSKGISGVLSKMGAMSKKILKIAAFPVVAVAAGVSALGKGIKSVVSGIGSIGSKVGSAIASPFKKIGGFFSSLNPFKKKDKKEDKKQKLRDKIMDKISKVIDKMWKVIEPLIDKVVLFMTAMFFSVIVPVALIAAKVLLIVAAIVAIGIGLYLVYKWVTAKVKQFWNYVTSGEMWKDIQAKLVATWGWLKDFGGWLWDLIIDSLEYIFVGMWVDLAEFVWSKLCQFGNWLYDEFIGPYIVEPLKKVYAFVKGIWDEKIWPKIEPFVTSLTKLKDSIVKAFSAWDTNKSIWDNLKNISGIIKDSVMQWWEDSPFKVFYEGKIKPFVESAKDLFNRLKNLGGVIKDAILDWWNGDSSLGETIGNIGGIVWDTVVDWWNSSVFKEYWEKLKNYLNDLMKPIKDWYEQSKLKVWVDKIKDIITAVSNKAKELIDKMSNATWKLPMVGFVRPFGFLGGKSFKLSDEEAKEYENITKLQETIADAGKDSAKIDDQIAKLEARIKAGDFKKDGAWGFGDTKADLQKKLEQKRAEKLANEDKIGKAKLELQYNQKEQARQLAQQQVQQAMQPIQSLDKMQTTEQQSLQQSSKEMAVQLEQKEEGNQQMSEDQLKKTEQLIGMMNTFMPQVLQKLDEPQATPVFVPYQVDSTKNSANMAYN